MRRATQTAEAIARRVGVRVVVEPGLIDRDYGPLLALLDPNLGPASGIGQRTACWNELVHVMGDWRVTRVDQKPPVAAVGAR